MYIFYSIFHDIDLIFLNPQIKLIYNEITCPVNIYKNNHQNFPIFSLIQNRIFGCVHTRLMVILHRLYKQSGRYLAFNRTTDDDCTPTYFLCSISFSFTLIQHITCTCIHRHVHIYMYVNVDTLKYHSVYLHRPVSKAPHAYTRMKFRAYIRVHQGVEIIKGAWRDCGCPDDGHVNQDGRPL